MGRENTIKWLESIEGKPGDDQEVQETPEEMNGSTVREESIPWDEIDPRHRSWKESAIYFWQSQKGRELSMGSSIVLALSIAVIGLAIILSDALTEDGNETITDQTISVFFLVMYTGSIIVMIILLTQGFLNKLTIDKSHKAHRNKFTMGGVTVLASGGIVYKGIVLAMNGMQPGCMNSTTVARDVFGAIFIAVQVGFLVKHSSIRINISLPVTLLSRMMLMLIIATNLCIWFNTIIEETLHEIHEQEDEGSHDATVLGSPRDSNDTDCQTKFTALDSLTGPYLFPLLIEFCVVASTMVLGVWEKTGLGLKVNEKIKKAKRDRIVAFTGVPLEDDEEDDEMETNTEAVTTTESTDGGAKNTLHQNSNTGFLMGWLVLLTSIVVVVVGLYNAYSEMYGEDVLVQITYASNLAFTIAGFVAVPIAFWQMSVLTHKDNEIKAERRRKPNAYYPNLHVPEGKVSITRRLDKGLITVTFYTLLVFKLMSMIAGYELGNWLIFCDGLACSFMALIQNTFIAWYAFDKRTTKESHRVTKPGRQALEFLRCCNLALWLVNTFLLKHPLAKGPLNTVFGHSSWVIISNIVQPLTILYYFHCTMCLAEIIHLCYTTKYIGIIRKSKQLTDSPNDSTLDLVTFIRGSKSKSSMEQLYSKH